MDVCDPVSGGMGNASSAPSKASRVPSCFLFPFSLSRRQKRSVEKKVRPAC